MTNPPNTEGLAAEAIDWLRSLPQDTQPIEFGTATFGLAERVFKSDQGEEAEWARTPAADTLIATLDAFTATAVKEERERVLAEIDAAASRLVNPRKDFTWSVAKDPQSLGECFEVWHTNPPQADDGFADAATFTEALLGENNQEGAE